MVVVAAFSQHAVGPVGEGGEQAARGGRLQARGAVRAAALGCRAGLWKRQHTGDESGRSLWIPAGVAAAEGVT